MKRKLSTTLIALIMIVGLGIGAVSCTTDNNTHITETQWKIVNIKINKNDWKWDNETGEYSVAINLPELTPFIFNEGLVESYIKFNDNTKANLPTAKSYDYVIEENGEEFYGTYTEHIRSDYQVGNPSTVAFYIEASDLMRADEYLETKYFQVVLVW